MNKKNNKREKIYRGAGRRRTREEKDKNRDARDEKNLLKDFNKKITFLSLNVVGSKDPVSSIIVVFRFNEPITPNNFYKMLENSLADKI